MRFDEEHYDIPINSGFGCKSIGKYENCDKTFCDNHLKDGLGAYVCLTCK